MDKVIIYAISATLLLLVIGCNVRQSAGQDSPIELTDSIAFSLLDEDYISGQVDSIKYLPLFGSEKYPITEISKIYVTDNEIAIGDKRQNKIVVFDANGQFRYAIDHRGQGPAEYLEIANFTMTDSIVYILDNYMHCVHKYSVRDGSFMAKEPVSFVAWDIEAFDDDSFLFTMTRNNPDAVLADNFRSPTAVWSTNDKWEIIGRYLATTDDHCEMYGKMRYFTKSEDKILFHSFIKNGYFVFKKDSEPEFVRMDFENPLPATFEEKVEDANDRKYEFLTETPFKAGYYTIFKINHDGFCEQYLYNALTDKFYKNSATTAYNGMINIVGISNSSPIGVIMEYDTYKMLTDHGFPRAPADTESLLKNDGYALVTYQMRT